MFYSNSHGMKNCQEYLILLIFEKGLNGNRTLGGTSSFSSCVVISLPCLTEGSNTVSKGANGILSEFKVDYSKPSHVLRDVIAVLNFNIKVFCSFE